MSSGQTLARVWSAPSSRAASEPRGGGEEEDEKEGYSPFSNA